MSETTNNKVKRVLNIALDVVLVLFLLFAAFVLIVALSQKAGKVSQLFGYSVRSVQSESMERYDADGNLVEGAFSKGDVIILEMADGGPYDVGDVVMFSMPINLYPDGSYREADMSSEEATDEIFVTHRIVGIELLGENYRYRTQGLGNPVPDVNLKRDDQILAVYNGTRIAGLGSVVDFLQTKGGFFLCIILPMLAFVLFQAYRVVNNVILYNREKAFQEASEAAEAAVTAELSEEQKRRIAEEYLKSLGAGANSADSSQPNGTEE